MVRRTAESRTDKPELEPDTHAHGVARDLRSRLEGLPGSHPSAAGYSGDSRRDSPGVHAPAADRVWTDDIRLTAERRTHILDGDQSGGGHRHGTGQPGKTEFPADWSDDRIIDAVLAITRNPGRAPERQQWNDRWRVSGEHDGLHIAAIVESDGLVWTAWPREGSPGVVKNGLEDT
jgi:hypothetical protein